MTVTLAAKSRRGIDLVPQLPPNATFGTVVHFAQQGAASLTLRRASDFLGPSALTIPGQVFCRQEGL